MESDTRRPTAAVRAGRAARPPEPDPAAAEAAVTAIYQAHALGLIRLAVIMLGDRPAAEDVVQEAFCGLYRRWHALTDTEKALSYGGRRPDLRPRRAALGDTGERQPVVRGALLLPGPAEPGRVP